MGMYSDLTDEELASKIVELRGKVEDVATGGVAVIAGEGRRMEYTRSDSGALRGLLKDAMDERANRNGENPYAAIGVIWP